jgi:hemoglobin
MSDSLFDQLGGEATLRTIVDQFVDRVFADVLVGFHFRFADKDRIKAKEYEFAAQHLGAGVVYSGRPMPGAHAPHGIVSCQFNRRLELLAATLDANGAPAAVRDHWLAHNEALRAVIMGDAVGERSPLPMA